MKQLFKNLNCVCLLLCLFLTASVFSSVLVTESTSSRLSFTFEMEDFSIAKYQAGNTAYTQISFKGSNTSLKGDGNVALPSQSLYVGVPPSGTVTAAFVSHSVKRITLDHPLFPLDDSVIFENINPVFDAPWMSRISYMHFRDMRTGHFYIRPFTYDPKTRVLTVCEKGSCTIEFPQVSTRIKPSIPLRSDFYSMLKSMVLNYSVASNWVETRKPISKRSGARSYLPNETMVWFKIGDGNGINEGTTNENGIVKIKGSDISPFFGSTIPVNKIALFASYKEQLDSVVPFPNNIPSGVRDIPIIRFDLDKDGIFDPEDYILAYVSGVCDWYYDTGMIADTADSSRGDFAFNQNRVENWRYYWIRVSGAGNTIQKFECNASADDTVTCFENRVRYKMSLSLMSEGGAGSKGGINWIWKMLDNNARKFSYPVTTSDVITDSVGYLRINKGGDLYDYAFSIVFGSLLDSTVGTWNKVTTWQGGTNESNLTLTFTPYTSNSYIEIESFDLKYRSAIDMKDRKSLRVYSPLDSGVVSYRLSNVPSGRLLVFRISPYESAISLIDTVLSAGGNFLWTDTTGRGMQYYICTESGLLGTPAFEPYIPVNPGAFEITDLHNGNNTVDYLIITHRTFATEALRLAEHKVSAKKFSYPKIVYVDDIFREFSGGGHDPAAIRNFLVYVYNYANWVTKPEYVVFLGSGHYDYKGYSSPREINYIPTAQFKQYYWKCVEDFFACITPGELVVEDSVAPDLFLGRIPCGSITEAQSVVNKIIDMEGPDADYSGWRNRILLVSDDDMQGSGPDYIQHYISNEDIEKNIKQQRPYTDVRKVILFEYPWNELYQKPEASSALINEINNGVSCVNFFGHGNEVAWADENIFNKDKVKLFHNYKQYPMINAFSCAVGFFDKPDENCLSDLFVTAPQAGAIAAISSSRTAFASQNTAMAIHFYEYYYNKDSSRTIGQAYGITKAIDNLKHYTLLGDPSMRFINITDTIEAEITTESGLPIDTLKALQTILVKGRVKRNNVLNQSFGTADKPASVLIGLYNPDQDSVTRKDGGTVSKPVYRLPGTPVFIGVVEFKEGSFEQKIQLPRRVTFEKPGVKLTVYAWLNGVEFGVGHKGGLVFIGTDTTNIAYDKTGPRITIRPVYDNEQWNTPVGFTDRVSGFLPLECEIVVWDESGIDVTGTGPDEGLSYEIEGVKERQNINNNFHFYQGEYKKGRTTIRCERDGLKPGQYTLIIRAQDMAGNTTQSDFTLEVLSDADFNLDHVFNYPNPVRMNGKTKFYFYHSNLSEQWHGPVETTIKIFTLSGKLIRVFHNAKNGQEWDLADQRGNRLTPNVYLYRVTAKMTTADISGKERVVKSPVKKLVIHPPR